MLKITEIIEAKIEIFGQDGGILTKFAKQKNEAYRQPFWQNKIVVLYPIVCVEIFFCVEFIKFFAQYGDQFSATFCSTFIFRATNESE